MVDSGPSVSGRFPTEVGELPEESDASEKGFAESLAQFIFETENEAILNQSQGWKIPKVSSQELKLYQLYRQVAIRGGFQEVRPPIRPMKGIVCRQFALFSARVLTIATINGGHNISCSTTRCH